MVSLVAQTVKSPSAMRETRVWSLGWENTLKSVATHSSILAWRIPMDRRAWRTTVHKVAKQSDTTEATWHACTHTPLLSTNVPSPLLCQKPPLHGEVANDVTLSRRPKNWLKTTALSKGVNRVLTRTYKSDGQHCGFILGNIAGMFSI